MHTVWKGNISFGLVNIPVKLFSAVEDKDIKMRNLHKECLTPIQYKKISSCDDDVTPDEIIKVYETPNGRLVEITDEEIKKLKEEFELKQVSIIDFIKLSEIDPIYYDKTYFIGFDTGGSKAYTLLSEILKKTKKVGVAKITIRSKQYLSVIRPYKNALILETLHFPDEVRSIEHVQGTGLDKSNISDRELQAGLMLVEQLTTAFEPTKYSDTYRTSLENLINDKVEKKQFIVTKQTEENQKDNVIDLMAALEASIQNTKKTEKEPPKKSKKKASS